MSGFLQQGISAVITLVVLGAIAQATLRAKAARFGEARMILPHRGVFIGLSLGCGLLGGFALYGWSVHDGGWAALILGIVFSSFAVLSVSALSPKMAVGWTAHEMTGPASYGMPPFGPRRETLRFDEVATVGVDAMGAFFASDDAGRKIRWNEYYGGFAELNEAIAEARPDLFAEDPRGTA